MMDPGLGISIIVIIIFIQYLVYFLNERSNKRLMNSIANFMRFKNELNDIFDYTEEDFKRFKEIAQIIFENDTYLDLEKKQFSLRQSFVVLTELVNKLLKDKYIKESENEN